MLRSKILLGLANRNPWWTLLNRQIISRRSLACKKRRNCDKSHDGKGLVIIPTHSHSIFLVVINEADKNAQYRNPIERFVFRNHITVFERYYYKDGQGHIKVTAIFLLMKVGSFPGKRENRAD